MALAWLRPGAERLPRGDGGALRLRLGPARLRRAPPRGAPLLLPRALLHHKLPLRTPPGGPMNEFTPLERVRAYYRDLNTGDPEKVARHFTPDAHHYYTRLGP